MNLSSPGSYLYLIIDLAAVSVPLIFSFYRPANFSHQWKRVWPSILIPAGIFVLWDIRFTNMGVWGFNPRYLTGLYFINLPVEEVLFFICIPYACLFTYFALNYLIKKEIPESAVQNITYLLVFFLLGSGLLNLGKWYTAVTFITCAIVLIYLKARLKVDYLGKFYRAFAIVLVPFFIVNGILTGTGLDEPVVWYNNSENLGLRMGTIPVEDTFYGMTLLLLNVSVFEWLKKE